MQELLELNHPISLLFFAAVFSLLPFFLLCFTPYIKFSVVFSLVKSSFGVQQFPSSAITSLLCLILSMYVMKPIVFDIQEQAAEEITAIQNVIINKKKSQSDFQKQTKLIKNFIKKAIIPLTIFLEENAEEKEKDFFLRSWNSKKEAPQAQEKIFILVPAFIITQLKQGFILGAALYLPLLLVDLLVSNILIALGINMISPSIISLPLKVSFFVAGDAWLKLCTSLLGNN